MFKPVLLSLCCMALTTAMAAPSAVDAQPDVYNHQLYFNTPAAIWEETLPLGNGRLGMMPDGGVEQERIVLNDISLWSGSECDYSNPAAADSLPKIRQYLFEGKNREAQELMYRSFVPKKLVDDARYGSYQMLGLLNLDFQLPADTVTHYRRTLSLDRGVATTRFSCEGVDYMRTYFVSRSRDVMLVHLKASRKGALNFTAQLSRKQQAEVSVAPAHGGLPALLQMAGTLDSGDPRHPGMQHLTLMRLVAQGGTHTLDARQGYVVRQADEAWLILSATTSYEAAGTTFPGQRFAQVADSLLSAIPAKPAKLQKLEAEHAAAHGELYNRVSLTLPASADDSLPTNVRLLRFAQHDSPAMAALYYNYGRYLLIGSTRPGSLPPNLQGLWANTFATPWNGDYHTNINAQMNHWPLEQAGLGELYDPLTTLIERLIPSGCQSAKAFYGPGAQGWVLHMMTNVWNYTAPGEHPSWGATNTGGAWLCAHLWEHYLYTRDKEYLHRIYPLLKGASGFFHTTTVREPKHGWLVTAPTSSPENAFYLPGDSSYAVSICMGPTMDIQLLTELYTNVIEAARILQIDADYAAELQADLKQFPPMQISKQGYLQEWLEDYREAEIHHRHVSHLYGLHPANLISPERTPELAEACRATLNRRGDDATGWSRAWKLNFWARLGDGNRALKLFRSLLQPAVDARTGGHGSGTFPNLFCSHPPFQIDGNYGGAAGVGEMLLQSHQGFIHLLPALPDSWDKGSFRGMRVRGGAKVDLDWADGRPTRATVTALVPGTFRLKMPEGGFTEFTLKKGESRKFVF